MTVTEAQFRRCLECAAYEPQPHPVDLTMGHCRRRSPRATKYSEYHDGFPGAWPLVYPENGCWDSIPVKGTNDAG